MSRLLDVFFLFAYAVASVIALLSIKAAMLQLQPNYHEWALQKGPVCLLILGIILYVISFLVWLIVLARLPLSIAYPVAIGLTLVFSTLGATLYLSETIDLLRGLGIVLIFIGIVCLTWRVGLA